LSLYADLADRLKRARYGVLIHGTGSPWAADVEAALALVRDLNRFTRFVALSPAFLAEESGAEAVLAWQAGAAGNVDFAVGRPRHLAHEGVVGRIKGGEADAVLLIGDIGYLSGFWIDEATLGAIPRVVVGTASSEEEWTGHPDWNPCLDRRKRLLEADAFLPTARAAIDEGGTVARFDGVMLPLRPPFSGRRPTQAEVLRAIDSRLATRQTRQDSIR
jgi:formylmethanofuran dehydrogenase subunit B